MVDYDKLVRRRTGAIVGGVLLSAAFIGFFAEVRKPTPERAGYASDVAASEPDATDLMQAKSYRQLRDSQRGPDPSVYLLGSELLRQRLPRLNEPGLAQPALRGEATTQRALRRAYDGAPPVIPHPVDQRERPNCLTCHEAGARIGDKLAPAMSHAPYQMCTQCHAPSPGADQPTPRTELELPPNGARAAVSEFVGMASAGRGARAYPDAPPTQPHRTFMRENCASCHGVAGHAGLRPGHLDRQNCQQCHVPSASAFDGVFARSQP